MSMYVAKLDFNNSEHYYVCRHDDGTWDERYCPVNATTFETVDEAVSWVEDNTTFGDFAKAELYSEAVKRYWEWDQTGLVRRQFDALDKASHKYDPSRHTKYDVLNWRWKNQGNDYIRYEDYRTWPDLFTVFDCLWSVVSYYKGRETGEMSTTIQIAVSKSLSFDTFVEELNLVLDRITRIDDDGDIIIDVMDHYCGNGGNWVYLHKHTDGTWSVKGRYNFQNHVDHQSLRECFDYLQRERYYD